MIDPAGEIEPVPLTVSIDLASELLGIARIRAYSMAKNGELPCLPGPGRRRVLTNKLEAMCARRLAAADIRAAEERLAPKREATLKYQASYRAERARIAAKKINRKTGGKGRPSDGPPA